MVDFDESARRLTFKLVHYGPALSGKTTNLMRLHDLLRPEIKGEIMTLAPLARRSDPVIAERRRLAVAAPGLRA